MYHQFKELAEVDITKEAMEVGKGNKVRRMDSLALKKQKYINYTVNGRLYEFQYVITDPSVYYLEVLFDRKRMLRFKINVDKSGL